MQSESTYSCCQKCFILDDNVVVDWVIGELADDILAEAS